MKRVFLGIAALAFILSSCEKETINETSEAQDLVLELDKSYHEQCATMGRQAESIRNNPMLQNSYDAIEAFTQKALKEGNAKFNNITIPVIFHVIYRTSSENLSNSVLQAQINAMNEDFNLNNPGRASIPAEFQPVEANVGINFTLHSVTRTQSSKRRWKPDDSMKFTSSGGIDVINPQEFLNIWIVNSMPYRGGQIAGYAQFPGGAWATDGVVMGSQFIGGTQRVPTHEVGHWLNLRHIWGDGGCSVDDFVADTPISDAPNRGCPSYPTVNCGSNDMTMNFMDYTSSPCMHMFTQGQTSRMMTVFAPGGFREAMAN